MGMALVLGVMVLNWKAVKEKFIYRFAIYNYLVGMIKRETKTFVNKTISACQKEIS